MAYQRLRDLREDRDWKQEEVARRIGVKQTTYSKYELGKINVPLDILIQRVYSNYERGERDIPTDILIRLSEFYDVSVDYLLGLTNNPRRNY